MMKTSRMNKPIPAATFKNIRPPNKNYKFFEDRQHHPFKPDATTFELVNAGWMADFANADMSWVFDATGVV